MRISATSAWWRANSACSSVIRAAAADAVLAFAPKLVYPYHFRGKDGMSDLDEFRRLVAAKPGIEVRVLDWY